MKTTKEKIQKLIKKKKDFTLTTSKRCVSVETKKKKINNCDVKVYQLDFYRPKETKRVFEFNGGRLVKQTVYYKIHGQ